MDYFPGLPLPAPYAARITAFRRAVAAWALRPQHSEPHLAVKGSADLDESPATLATIARGRGGRPGRARRRRGRPRQPQPAAPGRQAAKVVSTFYLLR